MTDERLIQCWRRPGKLSPEDAAFIELWQDRSMSEGFDPFWVFRTAKRTIRVDWLAVADERRLRRLSVLAERQYLAGIETARTESIEKLVAAGLTPREARIKFERALCKRDLYYLVKFVLGYKDLVFHFHKGLCEVHEQLPSGARELREAQRGGFKSTIWTIGWSVQQILCNPDITILLKSNSEKNAGDKLTEITGHFFDKNSVLGVLFPEMVPLRASDRGSSSFWRCPAATRMTTEGTLEAAGVGTSKTGRHYDVVIGDDFWDQKSVTSLELTAKVQQEMSQLKFLMIDQTTGKIIFVGTRFAHDDPTSELSKTYNSVIVSGLLPSGRTAFPERSGVKVYRRMVVEDGVYDFSCQIMLNPKTEDAGLNPKLLGSLRWRELKAEHDRGDIAYVIRILVDSAVDGKKSSDNVAIGVFVIDSKGRKTLVDGVREKMEPSVFVDTVCKYWDMWQPEYVVRQKTANETTLQSFFRERNRKREEEKKNIVRFYDYSLHKREKKRRITAAVQPRLAAGELFLDPDLPFRVELEKEFSDHPASSVDDFLDLFAEFDDPMVSRAPDHRKAIPTTAADTDPLKDPALLTTAGMTEREALQRREAAMAAYGRGKKSTRKGEMGRVVA